MHQHVPVAGRYHTSFKLQLVNQAGDVLHLAIARPALATVLLGQLFLVHTAGLELGCEVGSVGHGVELLGRLLRNEHFDHSVHPAHDGGHVYKEFFLWLSSGTQQMSYMPNQRHASYLEELRVRQCELLDDLGTGSLDVGILAEEGDALVVVHLDDLIGVLLRSNGLSG